MAASASDVRTVRPAMGVNAERPNGVRVLPVLDMKARALDRVDFDVTEWSTDRIRRVIGKHERRERRIEVLRQELTVRECQAYAERRRLAAKEIA